MSKHVCAYSVRIDGKMSAISVEPLFYETLKSMAATENLSISALVARIKKDSISGNLSSSVRIYVLNRLIKENHDLKSERNC